MEIIYGRNAVSEALKSTKAATRVARLYMLASSENKGSVDELAKLATTKRPAVDIQKADRNWLDQLTRGANHQGVAAEVSDYNYADFNKILRDSQSQPDALFLVLDYLQDPQNLGTLIRSAEATGVAAVIIPERRAAGITPAVRNASSGAVEHLHVCQVVNLPRALDELKEAGVWVAGLEDGPEAIAYDKADFKGRLALVVGSEGAGLSRLVRQKCDYLVRLPMLGKVDSLNAAVAGSITLYEALRQRKG